MSEAETIHPAIAIVLAVLVVGGVLVAIYVRLFVIKPRLQRIQVGLVDKYVEQQDSGDLDGAYEVWTTDAYKKEFPIDAYRKQHAQRKEEHGNRTGHEMIREYSPIFEHREGASYQLQYRMTFEDSYEIMAFEIVATDDGYRIARSHTQARPEHLVAAAW